jgi:hypothetical protein
LTGLPTNQESENPSLSKLQQTPYSMRLVRLEVALFIALAFPQDVSWQLLSSHDRIVGPLVGEYLVSDIQVFEDGRVIYSEEGLTIRFDRTIVAPSSFLILPLSVEVDT